MKFSRYILVVILAITLSNCSLFKKDQNSEENPVVKKKRINPNVSERAKEARDRGLVLFGKKVGENATVSFATSNPMWRASLEVLDFMPLEAIDYSGGIISTDWYKKNTLDKEEIKIRVEFLSNELSPSSIKIISHKRICEQNFNCKIIKSSEKLTKKIKNSILNKARQIKIDDENKKK